MGNLNSFCKKNVLQIGNKEYSISFIPYIIEKSILDNPELIQNSMSNMEKITEEQVSEWREWIEKIITHKRNENTVEDDFMDDFGFIETLTVLVEITKQVSQRVMGITDYFGLDDEVKKKIIETEEQTTKEK